MVTSDFEEVVRNETEIDGISGEPFVAEAGIIDAMIADVASGKKFQEELAGGICKGPSVISPRSLAGKITDRNGTPTGELPRDTLSCHFGGPGRRLSTLPGCLRGSIVLSGSLR